MKLKKLAALSMAALMAAGLTACGGSGSGETTAAAGGETKTEAAGESSAAETTGAAAEAGDGKVYFLNFKPESAEIWEEVVEVFTEETGNGNDRGIQYIRADIKV